MSAEKTEKPTVYHLKQLRKEGQIPQRKVSVEAGTVTFSTLALILIVKPLSQSALAIAASTWSAVGKGDWHEGLRNIHQAIIQLLQIGLIYCAVTSGFALLLGLFFNGFSFAPKALTPKFQKLNPVNNAKSLLSLSTLTNFLRLLVHFSLLSVILYITIYDTIGDASRASQCELNCLANLFSYIIKRDIYIILGLYIVIGLIDYKVQSLLFLRKNKMSKEEIKTERKNQEGDPRIKGARKSIAMRDANLPGLRQATHIVYGEDVLVAILYNPNGRSRPFVLAKVKGAAVSRIRDGCKRLGLPALYLPAVALEFYKIGAIGEYLPPRSAIGMEKILRSCEAAETSAQTTSKLT
ncbi:EscU/YscU/HrcU family type III secretion system export apparatus switch protein [Brucella intermedia]|uniref:EscU/YscU/HrcU family type III secretion system export apparatus switch protein n=1 Tax=Brucella intermedia TaxID=94625 RepID=UPI00236063F1|nr:EscU/YscU/HrcU family type III secretion system export apparatus switch protein [Brucella intermedia]